MSRGGPPGRVDPAPHRGRPCADIPAGDAGRGEPEIGDGEGRPAVRFLHRAERWVAVDKPAGIFVHRTRLGPDRDVLLQRVRDALGHRVSPVHRLDRPTSGVVLFGVDGEAVAELQAALARETSRKLYLALVRGVVDPGLRVVDRPLSTLGGEARAARTVLRRLAVLEGRFSLVLVRPVTGRRHQIRRHLGGLGHHVLGDVRYGKGRVNRELRERVGLGRLALHARRLELDLASGRVVVESPLPADLREPWSRLGAAASDLDPPWADPL